MKKKFILFTALSLFFISCSDEKGIVSDDLTQIDENATVITVKGNFIENNTSTRALLTEDVVNNKINIQWNENDKIYLYAIQGTSLTKLETAFVKNIRDENKIADFDIILPSTLTGEFKVIGSMAQLIHTEEGTLESYNIGMLPLADLREMPRYFEINGVTLENANEKLTSVNFADPGILLLVNIKNVGTIPLSRSFNIPNADWISPKVFASGLIPGNDNPPAVNTTVSIPAGGEQLLAIWRHGDFQAGTIKNIMVSINLAENKSELAVLLKGRTNAFESGKAYVLPEIEWDGERISNEANGDYMEFKYIPAGTFQMGSTVKTDPLRSTNEIPHQVTLDAFWMGKTPVTQEQWKAVVPTDPSFYVKPEYGTNMPVERVSWDMAAGTDGYTSKLNTQTGITLRLPTEAEWEYACRAGTTTAFYTGDCLTNLDANYDWATPYGGCSNTATNKPWRPTRVASYPANPWGLYDMSGNVYEWCYDRYGEYSSDPQTNPTGPTSGTNRVIRGGNWQYKAENSRSATRFHSAPSNAGASSYSRGFRLALSDFDF